MHTSAVVLNNDLVAGTSIIPVVATLGCNIDIVTAVVNESTTLSNATTSSSVTTKMGGNPNSANRLGHPVTAS